MAYTVLKAFPLSLDGFRVENVPVGASPDIPADLVDGLVAAGFIAVAGAKAAAPVTVPATDPVTIPEGWRELHHAKIIALAKSLGAEASTKDEAVAAIEAHLEQASA